jgi:enoyl-CoA hydratase
MNCYRGKSLSWSLEGARLELALHRPPINEMGTEFLAELEQFTRHLESLAPQASALIIYSTQPAGFSAGADLRELYRRAQAVSPEERLAGVRQFLEQLHAALNAIDAAPLTTIAAVNRICFGGGLELALCCDLIIADKTARFAFPELRLGLIPGFGGIPRLRRDVGNAVLRDLLLTGRSFNVQKAAAAGLVSQVAGEKEALRLARATAEQIAKFDQHTAIEAKRFIKPIPREELRREIDLFCELFARPAVMEALRRFVESTDVMPYLP